MLIGSRPWEGDSAASVALARLSGPIPDPMAVRPSVPPDLASITRRALALDPKDRWPSAVGHGRCARCHAGPGGGGCGRRCGRGAAAAGRAAGAAGAGRRTRATAQAMTRGISPAGAAAAGALVGATVVSGDRAPEPGRHPVLPPTPTSTPTRRSRRPATTPPPPPHDRAADRRPRTRQTSPLVWIAGIVAVAAARARSPSSSSSSRRAARPTAEQVTVPNLVGLTSTAASQQAEALGLTLTPTGQVSSDQPEGTVLSQDPPRRDQGRRGQRRSR